MSNKLSIQKFMSNDFDLLCFESNEYGNYVLVFVSSSFFPIAQFEAVKMIMSKL